MAEAKAVEKITKDTVIGEIVEKYPDTIPVLLGFGVHCVGCHVSPFETLEMGFKGHGMTDGDIAEAVKKLNETIAGKKEVKQEAFDYSKVQLEVTDKAAAKIKEYLEQEKKAGLRISVLPGGCSGYQYGMELDDSSSEKDIVIEEKDIKIFVDKESIKKLNGSQVDFIDSLQGAGFKINNPNAESTCGCGSSFG